MLRCRASEGLQRLLVNRDIQAVNELPAPAVELVPVFLDDLLRSLETVEA
jgi:hypothetical protein